MKLILISCFVGFNICDSFVSLFTGKACRQCTKFNKVFNDIIEKNPGLDYNITNINQNTSSYARHMNVSKIPVVIFEDGTRLTGVPRNYDLIRNKCNSSVKETRIPLDHLYSLQFCVVIYMTIVFFTQVKNILTILKPMFKSCSRLRKTLFWYQVGDLLLLRIGRII